MWKIFLNIDSPIFLLIWCNIYFARTLPSSRVCVVCLKSKAYKNVLKVSIARLADKQNVSYFLYK